MGEQRCQLWQMKVQVLNKEEMVSPKGKFLASPQGRASPLPTSGIGTGSSLCGTVLGTLVY